MTIRRLISSVALAMALGNGAIAMAEPVEFARDIQPLLQEHCIECHGPEQQNGYRLDRRSGALLWPVQARHRAGQQHR